MGKLKGRQEKVDNATRFIEAFVAIEDGLKEITGVTRYVKFYQLVQMAQKKNSIVKRYQEDLFEYADLRNAIVHQRSGKGEIIAQPVDSVVEHIEKIQQMICRPVLLQDYFLGSVKTCGERDHLDYVLKKMIELDTTKLPVYEDNLYKGLITMEMIGRYYLEHQNLQGRIKDITGLDYKKEKVVILAKTEPVEVALEAFEQGLRKGISVLAVLITEQGRADERPLGILTVADTPKMLRYL